MNCLLPVVGLLLLKLGLYLPTEVMINSNLVDALAAGAAPDQQHALVIIGRLFSGLAFVILVAGLLLPYICTYPKRVMIALIATFMIAIPLFYFGIKAAVDFVAYRTSATERDTAVILSLIPLASRYGFAKIADLPCNDISSYAGRTCLAMAPSMLFYDRWAVASVRRLSGKLERGLAMQEVKTRLNAGSWGQSKALRRSLDGAYQGYLQAGNYAARAEDIAASIWKRLQRLMKIQADYQVSVRTSEIQKIHSDLQRYFAAVPRSPAQAEAYYERKSRQLFHRVIPSKEWCEGDICPGSEHFVGIVVRANLVSEIYNYYHIDPEQLGSGPAGIQAFLRRQARSHKSGLLGKQLADILPAKWWRDDRATFQTKVARSLKVSASAILSKIQKQFGAPSPIPLLACAKRSSPPPSCYRLFVAIPAIRRGEWRALHPVIIRVERKIGRRYFAATGSYANGARNASVGRRAIRFVMVATVSLSLNLLFGLWNIVSAIRLLIIVFLSLLDRWRGRRCPAASNKSKLNQGAQRQYYLLIGFFVGQLAAVVLPFYDHIGLSAYSGYPRSQEIRAAPFEAILVDWVVRVEPYVLPVSDGLREDLLGSQPCVMPPWQYSHLMYLDHLVIGSLPGSGQPRGRLDRADAIWHAPRGDRCVL